MEEKDNRFAKISTPENILDDQFPIGLKVLALDSNIVCLKYLVQLLQKCRYKVTATTETAEALRLLNDEKESFDIIITNVVRHDMDGFKILEIVRLGMDIPVVMVSANEQLEMVKRGVMEGAEAYLLKPVSLQELRNIWQHVLRKRSRKRSNPNVMEQVLEQQKPNISHERVTVDKEDDEIDKNINLDSNDFDSSSSSKKKARVSWTKELHDRFVEAYEQLGEKERIPNNILKLMNDPRLSRENVASHLQKHRDMLRKKGSGVGKFLSKKNYQDRNSTKASKIYNSMNQRNNVSNLISPILRPQLPTIGQFQFSNLGRSSMEELEGNEHLRSTWTLAENYCPVPEFKWFNNFPSNNLIAKPCDRYFGYGPNNTNSNYPLESRGSNSFSQSFGNCPMDNVGEIPEQAGSLAWAFPNNNTTAGQCSQMQLVMANSHGGLLMEDDLSDILKQFQSKEAF